VPRYPRQYSKTGIYQGVSEFKKLKKKDLTRREHNKQKEDLIQQLTKRIEYIKKESSYFN